LLLLLVLLLLVMLVLVLMPMLVLVLVPLLHVTHRVQSSSCSEGNGSFPFGERRNFFSFAVYRIIYERCVSSNVDAIDDVLVK